MGGEIGYGNRVGSRTGARFERMGVTWSSENMTAEKSVIFVLAFTR